MPGSQKLPFDYVVVRVVPRVDRDEQVNVGVILFCAVRAFIGCELALDVRRLAALDEELDLAAIGRHLDGIRAICEADITAGPIARLSPSERFHWLSAPRSTVIQTSRAHAGVCEDPVAALQRLFDAAVKTCPPAARRDGLR